MYLLVAMAMISLTSCFGNAGNQKPTEIEAVEEVTEEVEIDTTVCDTTAVWFDVNEEEVAVTSTTVDNKTVKTFTMPANNVVITGCFEELQKYNVKYDGLYFNSYNYRGAIRPRGFRISKIGTVKNAGDVTLTLSSIGIDKNQKLYLLVN